MSSPPTTAATDQQRPNAAVAGGFAAQQPAVAAISAELWELEVVRALIARGQLVGVLTCAEIQAAACELDLDDADLAEL